jgi:hypothetical protein
MAFMENSNPMATGRASFLSLRNKQSNLPLALTSDIWESEADVET